MTPLASMRRMHLMWMVPMAAEGFHCIVIIIAIRAWGSGQAAAA